MKTEKQHIPEPLKEFVPVDDLLETVQFEERGDYVIGTIEAKRPAGVNNTTLYVLADVILGNISKNVWNSVDYIGVWETSVLKTKLSRFKEGDRIAIVYDGVTKGKTGRPYKNFTVYAKQPPF